MEDDEEKAPGGTTRRQVLKASGLALGGLVVGGGLTGSEIARAAEEQPCINSCTPIPACSWTNNAAAQRYNYFNGLPAFKPFDFSSATTIPRLCENEMRITFMGLCFPPPRKAQQMMSVFVEVGWNKETNMPLDQFVFDCGSGVVANYGAMSSSPTCTATT